MGEFFADVVVYAILDIRSHKFLKGQAYIMSAILAISDR
jgi:hypothetical protein